jgi:hypothetical protein
MYEPLFTSRLNLEYVKLLMHLYANTSYKIFFCFERHFKPTNF